MSRLLASRRPGQLRADLETLRADAREARAFGARMAACFASVPEALFVLRREIDGTLLVEATNPAAERLFGLRAATSEGRPAAASLPAALVATGEPCWREAMARGVVQEQELVLDLPAGRCTLQITLVPMRDAAGAVVRLLCSARDVGATRRLQASLVQSARLATVGTMAAGLAHEASQPLNVAALWLRRVRAAAEPLPLERRASLLRAATVVEEQLHRAGALVSHIRALAGDEPRRAEVFDAAPRLAAALRVAATQYASDGVSLDFQEAAAPALVRGNPARFEQAVLHLVSNARDAVLERRRGEPDAPGRIAVTLFRQQDRVVVEVRDSGTGLDPALGEAIFDPFFTTKEPGRGIGLGLAFAAGVARAMGGGIEAWSLPSGGACFRMELAAVEVVPAPRRPASVAA